MKTQTLMARQWISENWMVDMDWIHLVEDMNQWQTLVNMMGSLECQEVFKYLSNCWLFEKHLVQQNSLVSDVSVQIAIADHLLCLCYIKMISYILT